MEQIIKKAIEGGWKPEIIHTYEQKLTTRIHVMGDVYDLPIYSIIFDPLFFQALGKACGWNDENKFRMIGGVAHKINMETGKYIPIWIYHAIKFHEINLTQGWSEAVAYLEDIVTPQ